MLYCVVLYCIVLYLHRVHIKTCLLIDFQNSFTTGLRRKFSTKLMYYFPPHLEENANKKCHNE